MSAAGFFPLICREQRRLTTFSIPLDDVWARSSAVFFSADGCGMENLHPGGASGFKLSSDGSLRLRGRWHHSFLHDCGSEYLPPYPVRRTRLAGAPRYQRRQQFHRATTQLRRIWPGPLGQQSRLSTVRFAKGGLYDSDTGLVRFSARDYSAATGQWTARDPIDFNGGQLSLYAYAGNDPVNSIDSVGTGPFHPTTPPPSPNDDGFPQPGDEIFPPSNISDEEQQRIKTAVQRENRRIDISTHAMYLQNDFTTTYDKRTGNYELTKSTTIFQESNPQDTADRALRLTNERNAMRHTYPSY